MFFFLIHLSDLFYQKIIVVLEVLVLDKQGFLYGAKVVHAGIGQHGAFKHFLFNLLMCISIEETLKSSITVMGSCYFDELSFAIFFCIVFG